MGLTGDDRLIEARPHPERREHLRDRLDPKQAEIVALPPRRPLAERLERERLERERAERQRRASIERQRAERDRAIRERIERRRRERLAKLKREREELRSRRSRPEPTPPADPTPAPPAGPVPPRARVQPSVAGPVRRRARAAENRRRAVAGRRRLLWPTAKAGVAVSVVLGVSAALASALGLPVPGLDVQGGAQSLANSAALFGLDPGTPTGLSPGYVFPLRGAYDLGTKIDRFGAPRDGHVHEGQDIFGKLGTPEIAVHDGVVVDRGKNTDPDSGGRGNFLAIYSPRDDRSFVYMHMLKPPPVFVGQQVHAGEVIGQLGCSGDCDGPHLHFEVRIGRASPGAEVKAVDPLPYLRQWPQATPG